MPSSSARRPRVSAVVPIYNVEAYLEACLDSLAGQTLADLEVVLVDDGSTDGSLAIGERYAEQDPRFRLVRQENAGLGAARNRGATEARGEFLAFVDSDDLVPPRAYEALVAALDSTGSDFASGNARRVTPFRTARAGFLGRTFDRTRLATHITRYPRLLLDRTAWNKLFRRSFWDEHGFRFPEGVLYEDIAVTLPAHYLAKSVDVLEETVYLWRMREGDALSITQRRTEPKALRDRVTAVDTVSRFLAARRLNLSKLLYDRTVVGQDLTYFLSVLPAADESFRELFLELVNDFLDRADSGALDQPLAIERLKWQLVRRRGLPELLEVLRNEEELSRRPPVRRGRHWYGDFPYRDDPRLDLPADAYRLYEELSVIGRVESLGWEDDALVVAGYAYVDLLGAAEPGAQQVEVIARRRGWPPRRVSVRAETVHRPDLTGSAAQEVASLDHTGFVARIPIASLRGRGWAEGTWQIFVRVETRGLRRKTSRLEPPPLHPAASAELRPNEATRVEAVVTPAGELLVRVERPRAVVTRSAVERGVLQIEGTIAGGGSGLLLEVPSPSGAGRYPAFVDRFGDRPTFVARIPIGDLDPARAAGADGAPRAPLHLRRGGQRLPLALGPDAAASVSLNGVDLELKTDARGRATIVGATEGAGLDRVELSADNLVLEGTTGPVDGDLDLVLALRGKSAVHRVPVKAADGRFRVELAPGKLPGLAEPQPLGEGSWALLLGRRGEPTEAAAQLRIAEALRSTLPRSSHAAGKPVHVGVAEDGGPVVAVERALAEGERGGFAQRRLRTRVYPARRSERLREAVLYLCFGGAEYSDSPRALHEELLRRDLPLEHLWVVRDSAFSVPGSAVAVPERSEDYYDALARARYVISNDHWPAWFRRRPDQVCLQTWHGAPVKRLGLALADRPRAFREHRRALAQHPDNWQYVLSPEPFATSLFEQAFAIGGELLETGLPRTDLVVGADRDETARSVRERLGLRDERIVLYAPTYRDQFDYGIGYRVPPLKDRRTYQLDLAYRDGYRLGEVLDVAAVAAALPDCAVLFYKHPRVVDPLPVGARGAVRDVSGYPEGLDLLLAADVLVTDYSSWIFDFSALGRPVVLYTPDLEPYRDEYRGLSIDLEASAPGPIARTPQEVIDALRDLQALRSATGERRASFVREHCRLADGKASARAVDAVFRG